MKKKKMSKLEGRNSRTYCKLLYVVRDYSKTHQTFVVMVTVMNIS